MKKWRKVQEVDVEEHRMRSFSLYAMIEGSWELYWRGNRYVGEECIRWLSVYHFLPF